MDEKQEVKSPLRSKLSRMRKNFVDKMSHHFYWYGKFCTSHPWEVIVTFFTLSICIFSMGSLGTLTGSKQTIMTMTTMGSSSSSSGSPVVSPECLNSNQRHNKWTSSSDPCIEQEDANTDVIIVTIIRCLALLYVYHQFRNLYKLGSKYLVGIAGLFTVFSSFIFCSGVINVLNGNFSELNKAMPLFLLLADLPKASLLARFALSSFSREEVRENVARGMAIIGPSLTLDTIVESLAVGIGAMSGVLRLEELSCFACLSILVNYIIFMTIFPSCLSLALELSHNREEGRPVWQLSSLTKVLQLESEHAPNPVIQRVKIIMSVGLVSVHMASCWENGTAPGKSRTNVGDPTVEPGKESFVNGGWRNSDTGSAIEYYLRRKLSIGPEQLIMLGLVFVLVIKYIFFDSRDDSLIAAAEQHQIQNQQKHSQQQESQQPLQQQQKHEGRCTPLEKTTTTTVINSVQQHSSPSPLPSPTSSPVSQQTPSIVITTQDSDTESVIAENKSKLSSSQRGTSGKASPAFFIGDDCASDFSEDLELADKEVQTDPVFSPVTPPPVYTQTLAVRSTSREAPSNQEPRDLTTLKSMLRTEDGPKQMTDEEVLLLVSNKCIQSHRLESVLDDPLRGVKIRRMLLAKLCGTGHAVENLPYDHYDYSLVMGACCENVIGYMPVPVGVAGPLLLDSVKYQVPLATTEGCLVASTNRGCLALSLAGGVRSSVVGDGMTRGPVVRFPSSVTAAEAMNWLQEDFNFQIIKETFDSTSRFARLIRVHTRIAGRYLFIRFSAKTGDAMGMNMLSKGTESALNKLQEIFPEMEIISLSGNFCSDKKPSAVNWIEGRGKSVVCEAEIPEKIVREILKTDIRSLVDVNISKNLIGSAISGSIGGFNAHAANIVAAIYIATGQDPAQNIGSSNCMTLIESCGENNENLYISCTMPSLELGTIGGGTILPAQSACLELLGVKGSCVEEPGRNAQQFARVVCATVLAAELSLLSALAAGHLVKSHMKHNRSAVSINATPTPSVSDFLKPCLKS